MKPGRLRRLGSSPATGLAFLDVLCCGLGSAVFLLLVIQRGPAPVPNDDVLVAGDIARVEADIDATEHRIETARNAMLAVAETIRSALAALQALDGLSDLQKRQVTDALSALASARQRLRAEQADLARLRPPAPAPATPRQHLTGLTVRDDRVAVFLDSSASMLDSSLVEILRLRVSPDHLKRAAEKWTTARSAARWVYDRLPERARYRLYHYADKTHELQRDPGGTRPGPIAWQTKTAGPVSPPRRHVNDALNHLIPAGPTNLHRIFETAARLSPPPAQVILITDGLPTIPGDTPLRRLKHCPRPRQNRTPLIPAKCRASIFEHAARVAARSLPGVVIDIILLPLEGDAAATGLYWNLALASDGRLLTPARGWPDS